VQFSLNGAKMGPPTDLYGEKVTPTHPVELGSADIIDGMNVVALDITGKNNNSKNYYVGLEYFKLTPSP
jgi:hypothetical protein